MIEFSFEKLAVWQEAVNYAKTVIDITEQINTSRKHYRLVEQLESSSASVALNIAEGKGRYSKKEFIQFLYIARASLFESVTLIIIFNKKNWIDDAQLEMLKAMSNEIGKMLSGLIQSIRKGL